MKARVGAGLACWWVAFGLAGPAGLADEPSRPGAVVDSASDRSFPSTPAVVDVTKPPYNARGDGLADDTRAIQQALSDVMGQHKIVYLPAGTYLVSSTLRWSKRDSKGNDAWGFNTIQGRRASKTVLKLKDATFTDAKSPRPILWCGGFGSADWFHNYIQDVTFDVGLGNPGAIGLQFYSNNTGAVRNVAVVSGDGLGAIGLDLASADMNGPLLVRDVLVRGFELGIRTGGSVNSQTFERITLVGQSRYGLANLGQCISVRGLLSENAVPAIRSESFAAVVDSRLVGKGASGRSAAIELGPADFYARDVATEGYRAAIAPGLEGAKEVAGPRVDEFLQGRATSPFGGGAGGLRLPVPETPEVPADDPATWAVVDAFGADPTGRADSSDAIQRAVDSGASTVFFPGAYSLSKPVRVRGAARRLLGSGNWIDYFKTLEVDLIIEDGPAPVVVVEHFAPINGVATEMGRAVVFRSAEVRRLTGSGRGDLFLEDFGTNDLRVGPGRRAWARQLNIENEGTHLTIDGGTLWVLGYKTERGGTLLHARNGGRGEILGNFSYTTTAGKLAPMFVTEDASVFAFFHEICYSGDPFRDLIRETRRGVTRAVRRGEGGTAPYLARPGD